MLKVAIVGCGKIADGHIEEIQKLEHARLVAVCDLEPIMAEQIAVRYGVPHRYSDFDRMLEHERPEVVHITTPPQSHLPLTRKAIAAGGHVYVEKPLTPTYIDARELIGIVEASGKKMTINYWPNFDPTGIELRRLIDTGVLGEPVHIESYLGYNLSGAFGQALLSDPQHWVHHLPGKLFQNNLDHIINKLVPLLPEGSTEVQTLALRRREALKNNSSDQVLDELRVIIRAGNVTAYATFCSHARPAAHFVRIYGTRNSVTADFNARTVILDRDQTVPSALGRLLPPFGQARVYLKQACHNAAEFARSRAHYFAGMNRLMSLFYASILEGGPLPIPYSHILRTSAIMEQITTQVYPQAARSAECKY